MLYPTGSSSPDLFWTKTKSELLRGNQIHVEDTDLDWFFPNGFISFRMSTVPGNGFPLTNDFRVFISAEYDLATSNKCIDKQFSQTWRGNIVVGKYGRGPMDGFIQIQIYEPASLHILVAL